MPWWIASWRLKRSRSPASAVPIFIASANSASFSPDFTIIVRAATNCAAVKPPALISLLSKSRVNPISSAKMPAASFTVTSFVITPRVNSFCSSPSCSPTALIIRLTSSLVLRKSKLKSPPSASDLMLASLRAIIARISSLASSAAMAVVSLKPCLLAVIARLASSLTSTTDCAVSASNACCAVSNGSASGGVPSAR